VFLANCEGKIGRVPGDRNTQEHPFDEIPFMETIVSPFMETRGHDQNVQRIQEIYAYCQDSSQYA
jgi:hypothetical protein